MGFSIELTRSLADLGVVASFFVGWMWRFRGVGRGEVLRFSETTSMICTLTRGGRRPLSESCENFYPIRRK